MSIGLLGKKLRMTELFNEHGRAVPITVLQAGPCTITQVKTKQRDGYHAVQVGFESRKEKGVSKPLRGQFKKSKTGPFRYVREFRVDAVDQYEPGQQLSVELFKEGELVDVTGVSIGKGFQGGVKRWHWRGGRASRGSMTHRAPGAIGSGTDPGRVWRGHHLPGHMGDERVTIQNLRIMRIDLETNQLLVQGPVPGPEQRLIMVRKSTKKPGVIVAAKILQAAVTDEGEEEASKKKAPATVKKK